MGESGKVSGRGGWKQTQFRMAGERELNKREKTAYERYCAYCKLLGCEPAPEQKWYDVNQTLGSR